MPTYPFDIAALFDAIQDPAVLLDVDGRFTELNRTFLERAQRRGYLPTKEIWIGRHFWDTSLLRDPQRCEAFVRRALAQGSTGVKERFIYDFNPAVHMDLTITALRDSQGRVAGAMVLWENATTLVRQEQRREIIPQVREAIWRMGSSRDMEGILVAVRNSLEELGVPFDHCGVNLVDAHMAPPGIRSHNMTQEGQWVQVEPHVPGARTILQIWGQQEVAYRKDLRTADPYGEAGVIAAVFGPDIRCVIDLPFSHGTLAVNSTAPDAFDKEDIDALQAMARVLSEGFQRLEDFRLLEQRNQDLEKEVAERRRAEEALQESEARFRRLTDDLPIGIAHSTPEGRVLYANPYSAQLMGYTPEEMTRLRAQDLYLRLEDREELVGNLREKGEHAFEFQLRHKDGQPVWVRGKTRAYRDNVGQVYYLGITEDIDQRKQQELRQEVFQRVREEIWKMEKPQDLPRLLNAVQEGLRALGVNFTNFGINLIDTRTAPPSVTNHSLTLEGEWHRVSPYRQADHPLLRIWQRQEVVYRPDIHRADPYGEQAGLERFAIRCLADAPFSQGTLAISSREPEVFSAGDLQVLQEMSSLLSEGFKRLEDLQNLEHRAQEAESLAAAIAVVAQAHQLEEVFQAVGREATRLTSSERAALFLYDEGAGALVPRAQVGHTWETYRHIRLQPGEDLSGQVFATGIAQLYGQDHNPFTQGLRPENRALLEQAAQSAERASGAAVPLRLENRVLGT
ncbi:MAG: PAS domain S-box protein, partial [Candidatus Latescibacteria bacterium]|nr:PAS domain S-box protein [Candidatus Latescibacterota bacterium]